MRKLITLALGASLLTVSACSHTEKVATVKPTDSAMSCADITKEFADLDTVMKEAKKNKGASGANIAAAVFFWPAAVGNYMDAKDSEELVAERREKLAEMGTAKGCS